MKWIWMLVIFFVWTSWIGRYALWFAEGDKVKTDKQMRYEYLQTSGKPALDVITALNDAIDEKTIPDTVVVYGLGMEQYRFFANFKLIGGLYGWANHKDLMEAIKAGGAKGMYEWLRKYNVDYLAVDQWTIDFSAHEYWMSLPTDDPEWDTYFIKLNEGNQNALFKLNVMN
jgi:hypothetical protein